MLYPCAVTARRLRSATPYLRPRTVERIVIVAAGSHWYALESSTSMSGVVLSRRMLSVIPAGAREVRARCYTVGGGLWIYVAAIEPMSSGAIMRVAVWGVMRIIGFHETPRMLQQSTSDLNSPWTLSAAR
jgi:hypothetical protein